MFQNVLGLAKFARGYLEEVFPHSGSGSIFGMAGVFDDGFPWAGGDLPYTAAASGPPQPFRDGDVCTIGPPNPQSDMGEIEVSEFVQPTNLYIGRRIVPNYCGHGKYRSGMGFGGCQLIVDPGQRLIMNAFIGGGGIGFPGLGMVGGYPAPNAVAMFVHDTNMRELISSGQGYPRDFFEIRKWIEQGKLKTAGVEYYNYSTPTVDLKDGDLFACAVGTKPGWGDVLERDPGLVENDLDLGWITPDVARTVYGVEVNTHGKVDLSKTKKLRKSIRDRRQERSLEGKDWWKQERAKVHGKDFRDEVNLMYADSCKYEKFRDKFTGFWHLPEDY